MRLSTNAQSKAKTISEYITEKIVSSNTETSTGVRGNITQLVSRDQYIKEFDSSKNGQLHEQDWIGPEIDKFHQNLSKLNTFFCINCKEYWPTISSICSTCNKNNFYTKSNLMDPSLQNVPDNIKKHFENITMVEEMLISPVLAVMSIYRLPGGQLISKGYVANFSQDIKSMCHQLPRMTKDLPLLIIKKSIQNNTNKDFNVNRKRIEELLTFFCEYNPLWKKLGITIDQRNLMTMPENSIPIDLNVIAESTSAFETIDKIVADVGPEIADNLIDSEEDESINAYVESDGTDILQIDSKNQKIIHTSNKNH